MVQMLISSTWLLSVIAYIPLKNTNFLFFLIWKESLMFNVLFPSRILTRLGVSLGEKDITLYFQFV